MQKFELVLRNEKKKLYNRLSWFIIFIHIACFAYLTQFNAEKKTGNYGIFILGLLAAAFLLKLYFRKTKYEPGPKTFFIIISFSWIFIGNYWFAAASFLFDILHTITTRPLVVRVSKANIVFPSFPAKQIEWSQLSNVLLKDGLLTLDFSNNKLIQQVIDNSNKLKDEKEFNDFCKAQLNAASSAS